MVGLPVYKLLGAARDKVPAYACTMCGDDIPGGLDTPEAYGAFAKACKAKGYTAFKLHTWMSPYGPDLKRDIAACAAVRDAVGPEMKLMLDPHHDYTREEALYLGRALEELDYYWMEEPMDEHTTSSFVWLTENLTKLQICGPETAHGQMYTRAEWIVRGASDISRVGRGRCRRDHADDEGRPPLRGIPAARGGAQPRRGEPAGARGDGDPRRVLRAWAAAPARRFRRREALAEDRRSTRSTAKATYRSRRGRGSARRSTGTSSRSNTVQDWH